MKILVLGAGVVGTTTAAFLAEAGHAVTVIDREPGPGRETSFANGGQISACHAKPWAGPGVPMLALKWMLDPGAPLRFRPWRWDPPLWRWSLQFLANCTTQRARINMERTLRVALYSRAVLKALRQRMPLSYDQQTDGILHIYRSDAEFADGRATAAQLATYGLPQQLLSPADCIALEPALRDAKGIAGGLLSPDDESGDAYKFSGAMTAYAQTRGATFRFDESVTKIVAAQGRIAKVITTTGEHDADMFVLALGSFSPLLSRDLGLSLPVYPAKGYSITVPIADTAAAPTISITDETKYIVVSRLGDRLRVAGTAEFTGWNHDLDPVRIAPLLKDVRALFPRAATYETYEAWCGLRPTTPDSVPILGATPYENLLLNTGHGTLGWTMACGSAQIIADLIAGRRPEIDLEGLELRRFEKGHATRGTQSASV